MLNVYDRLLNRASAGESQACMSALLKPLNGPVGIAVSGS